MANVNRGPITPRPRSASGLDWDDVWSDAVHSHQSNAEGGTLDHGAALTGLTDDDHPQYKNKTGISNRSATLSYASGVFSISAVAYDVWVGGVKYAKSTEQTVAIANDRTLYYVYFNTSGVLTASTSAWDITGNNAPVAVVYRLSASVAAIGDERHTEIRDKQLHAYLHYTIGCRYDSARGGLTGTFGNTTFTITAGYVWDEDLVHTIAEATTARLWYRYTGAAAMTFESGATVPYKLNGTNIQYDNAGTLTDASLNYYVCSYVFGTNDVAAPIYVLIGQGQHANIIAARNETVPSFAGLSTVEWKLLYRLIYRNTGSPPTYQEAQDFRLTSSVPTTFAPTAHASLTGLGADDHTQYVLHTEVDDVPVDGADTDPISSNWAYDHAAAADPHPGYMTPAEHTAVGDSAPHHTEAHVHDASVVTYAPAVAADWDSSTDPGDVDNALDQLAERVADLEGAGGGGADFLVVQAFS